MNDLYHDRLLAIDYNRYASKKPDFFPCSFFFVSPDKPTHRSFYLTAPRYSFADVCYNDV
jgi:hypothetical protein